MNKKCLVTLISNEAHIEPVVVADVIEAYVNVVKKALREDEKICISGFGTFCTQKMAEKKARNIKTGETVIIPEHVKPKFRPLFTLEDDE